MPERSTPRKLALSEAFTGLQSRSVQKFRGTDLFPPFEFDGSQPQPGCAAAHNS
jgi:hypothetical protein